LERGPEKIALHSRLGRWNGTNTRHTHSTGVALLSSFRVKAVVLIDLKDRRALADFFVGGQFRQAWDKIWASLGIYDSARSQIVLPSAFGWCAVDQDNVGACARLNVNRIGAILILDDSAPSLNTVSRDKKSARGQQSDGPTNFNPIWLRQKIG